MTEFEKWKEQTNRKTDTRTLDEFIKSWSLKCAICPASKFCDEYDDNFDAMCEVVFKEWGNKRVGDT